MSNIYVIEVPHRLPVYGWIAENLGDLMNTIVKEHSQLVDDWQRVNVDETSDEWLAWIERNDECDDDKFDEPGARYIETLEHVREVMLQNLQNIVFAESPEELVDIAKFYNGHKSFEVRDLAQKMLGKKKEYWGFSVRDLAQKLLDEKKEQ